MLTLHTQTLLGPLSSADRIAFYLLETERKHFNECLPTLSVDFSEDVEPHIFAHILNHLVSIGETFELTLDEYNCLSAHNWLPDNYIKDEMFITIRPK